MFDSSFVRLRSQTPSANDYLVEKTKGKLIPWSVMFEITQKCNLKCLHCYNYDREATKSVSRFTDELTDSEILDAITQVIETGCWAITFTGGEVLMHPSLNKFIKHARSYHAKVALKTNGLMVTDAKAKELADLGVHDIGLSFYGCKAETHDAFTAKKGSFVKTIQACDAIVRHGMLLTINGNVTETNGDEIQGLRELAMSYQAGFVMNPSINVRHDGSTTSTEHRAKEDTLYKVFSENKEMFLAGGPDLDPERFMQCACATVQCAIAANGDVYPCINAPLKSGNVRDQSFHDIWHHSPIFNRIRELKSSDFSDCTKCTDKPWCSRSSGNVFTNTGNYTGSDKQTCLEANVKRQVWEDLHGPVDVEKEWEKRRAKDAEEGVVRGKPEVIPCAG